MQYFVLFMQISLEFIRNLKHFVLQYFCNFNSPKNLHLPVGQVKNRIHLPDRKIH